MASIMSNLQTVFTSVVSMAGSVLGTVTSEGNEYLELFLLLPIVGIGVGMLSRLFHISR